MFETKENTIASYSSVLDKKNEQKYEICNCSLEQVLVLIRIRSSIQQIVFGVSCVKLTRKKYIRHSNQNRT